MLTGGPGYQITDCSTSGQPPEPQLGKKKAKTETVFMPRGCTREPLMLFSKMF